MGDYSFAARIDNEVNYNSWVVSSEEDNDVYYIVVKYLGGEKYRVRYSFGFDKKDRGDLDYGGDIPSDFKRAYELKEGSYPNCCSLIAGSMGTDETDMYKIRLGKNKKLIVRLTPEVDALLGVRIYDENEESQVSKKGANKGAIVTAEYVSIESQTVYVEALKDLYSVSGGNYGLEIGIEDASSAEISAAKPAVVSSSSSSSGFDYSAISDFYGNSNSSFLDKIFQQIAIWIVVFIILYIYISLALMSMAKKTGTPNAWFAWVPILNLILMANIAQMSAWLLFLLLVPIANLIIIGMLWWKIAERRGFSGGLGLLMFVPIANLIMPGVFAWKKTGSEVSSGSPMSSKPKPVTTQPTKSINQSVKPSKSTGSVKNTLSSLGSDMSPKKKKLFFALLIALGVLAISILLPWASIGMGMIGVTVSGWSISWTLKVLFFLILGVGALVYFKKEQGAKASLGLSGFLLLYMIFRLIIPPSIGSGFVKIRLSISLIFKYLGFGFYLFVIATIAMGIVAWLFLKEKE